MCNSLYVQLFYRPRRSLHNQHHLRQKASAITFLSLNSKAHVHQSIFDGCSASMLFWQDSNTDSGQSRTATIDPQEIYHRVPRRRLEDFERGSVVATFAEPMSFSNFAMSTSFATFFGCDTSFDDFCHFAGWTHFATLVRHCHVVVHHCCWNRDHSVHCRNLFLDHFGHFSKHGANAARIVVLAGDQMCMPWCAQGCHGRDARSAHDHGDHVKVGHSWACDLCFGILQCQRRVLILAVGENDKFGNSGTKLACEFARNVDTFVHGGR